MNTNYETVSTEVINKLELDGYSVKTLAEHRRCFGELRIYLSAVGVPFSMEVGLEWLESRKSSWSYDTYKRYRRALYRFEKYLRHGEIGSDPHCGNNRFAYHDTDVSYLNLPDKYKVLYRGFYEVISGERAKGTVEHYVAGCTDFLQFMAEQGCAAPAEMTIELPIGYLRRIRENTWSFETKLKYAEGVGQLLTYLSRQGYIPRCYAHVMRNFEDEAAITSLKLNVPNHTGTAFQPSKALEPHTDSFLSNLDERRYSEPPQQMFGFIFRSFFQFLEINHLPFSAEATQKWLNHIPKTTSWELKRQIITWFANYMETGSTERASSFSWKPLLIDTLPKWSRKITDDYLELRKKEGWESSTLMMIRSSCVRFFRFIDSKGISDPSGITPSVAKEFHDTDPHATPQAGNAYGARVRKLLNFMAEENLVPQNLYLAISTQCAPSREIVTVMSEDMIAAVYRCRKNAVNSMELRDAAMVMIGLGMGIRASDVVSLKVGNFDWKNRKVSFVQKKTNKAITLPISTDVGNSVYKYIAQGRPRSSAAGNGFVFIRHNSPYTSLNKSSCGRALTRILSANGLKLPHGQGFHITRRTFATRLLKARTKVDSIVDSLGHASWQSIDDYLAHDADGMRLCPLPFAIGGVQ